MSARELQSYLVEELGPEIIVAPSAPSPLDRFAAAMGRATALLCSASLSSGVVAALLGAATAALLFLGAAIGAAVTLGLVSLFEQRLGNG